MSNTMAGLFSAAKAAAAETTSAAAAPRSERLSMVFSLMFAAHADHNPA
jgi:hypothetical protein